MLNAVVDKVRWCWQDLNDNLIYVTRSQTMSKLYLLYSGSESVDVQYLVLRLIGWVHRIVLFQFFDSVSRSAKLQTYGTVSENYKSVDVQYLIVYKYFISRS